MKLTTNPLALPMIVLMLIATGCATTGQKPPTYAMKVQTAQVDATTAYSKLDEACSSFGFEPQLHEVCKTNIMVVAITGNTNPKTQVVFDHRPNSNWTINFKEGDVRLKYKSQDLVDDVAQIASKDFEIGIWVFSPNKKPVFLGRTNGGPLQY